MDPPIGSTHGGGGVVVCSRRVGKLETVEVPLEAVGLHGVKVFEEGVVHAFVMRAVRTEVSAMEEIRLGWLDAFLDKDH